MGEKNCATWLREFKSICESMRRIDNETTRTLPDRGKIVWMKDVECKNCHHKGVFYGDELDYGEFYECARLKYCPYCETFFDLYIGVNFDPERFLPIMKKKLLANPELRKMLEPDLPCPKCGGETYTFVKDLGGIDYCWNYWTVCVNPNCDWPGSRHVRYEPGPYI